MDILDEYANDQEFEYYPFLMDGETWYWIDQDFCIAEDESFQSSIYNDPEPTVCDYIAEYGQYYLDSYIKVYYTNGHFVEKSFIPMFFEIAPVCFEYANSGDCWEWITDDEWMDDMEDGPDPDDPGYHPLIADRIDFSDYEFVDNYWWYILSMVKHQSR